MKPRSDWEERNGTRTTARGVYLPNHIRDHSPAEARREGGRWHHIRGAGRLRNRVSNRIELPIGAQLIGENSQKVVVRDAAGKPTALSGYTQGRSAIIDAAGKVIFEGRYYDTRTYQELTGDEALTPTGIRICDHWINGFGRGSYAGHAFALGVHLTREHAPAFRGEARGRID